MKTKIKILATLLFIMTYAASMHAVTFKNLLEEPPPSDSPAGVYLMFLKAANNDDIETMKANSTGYVLRQMDKEETLKSYIDRAKSLDWSKPVTWAQKIEGDTAKVAYVFKLKENGRTFRSKIKLSKVGGVWKYGD